MTGALPRVDALVVGLGPAGAATAIRLARLGCSVAAIDREAFPREKACSEYLGPETVRQLELLGVLDRIEPLAVPLAGARVVGPRGSSLTGLFREAGSPTHRRSGLSIPRRVLDAVLVDAARAAGVRVHEATRLESLVTSGGAVTGAITRERSSRRAWPAGIVIGADGLHSRVAAAIGGRWREPLRRWAFVAHVADVAGVRDTAELHVGRGAYAGLNAVARGVANVVVVAGAVAARGAAGDPEGFWHRTLESFPGVRGRVRRDRIVRPVMVTGPFGSWARRPVAEGALLVGDAADFFDPFTGEGIASALRGAALAAPLVAAALERGPVARARDLAGYRAARREAFLGKWAVERLIGYGMLAPALFDRAVGRLGRRGMGHTFVGVTGEILPARAVLNPGFLMAMVL